MSDDDRDIDVESDDGEESDTRQLSAQTRHPLGNQYCSQAEKRAHHNALERKRRDHIKDSFSSLRDTVPLLSGEKVASRAQILKKASEYIVTMRKKTNAHQRSIDDLKRQNSILEAQLELLEKLKAEGPSPNFDVGDSYPGDKSSCNETETDSSDEEVQNNSTKKIKVVHQ